jgi:hypothetical protein
MIGKGQVIKIGDTARQHTYTLSPTWLPPRRKNARPPKEAGDEQLKRRPYSQRRTDDGVPLRVRILAAFAPGENLTTRELADRLDSPVTSVGAQISEMIRAGLLHVAQPATPGVERWDRYTPGPLPPPPEPWGPADDRATLEALASEGDLRTTEIRTRLGRDRFTTSQIQYRLGLLASRGEVLRGGPGQWAIGALMPVASVAPTPAAPSGHDLALWSRPLEPSRGSVRRRAPGRWEFRWYQGGAQRSLILYAATEAEAWPLARAAQAERQEQLRGESPGEAAPPTDDPEPATLPAAALQPLTGAPPAAHEFVAFQTALNSESSRLTQQEHRLIGIVIAIRQREAAIRAALPAYEGMSDAMMAPAPAPESGAAAILSLLAEEGVLHGGNLLEQLASDRDHAGRLADTLTGLWWQGKVESSGRGHYWLPAVQTAPDGGALDPTDRRLTLRDRVLVVLEKGEGVEQEALVERLGAGPDGRPAVLELLARMVTTRAVRCEEFGRGAKRTTVFWREPPPAVPPPPGDRTDAGRATAFTARLHRELQRMSAERQATEATLAQVRARAEAVQAMLEVYAPARERQEPLGPRCVTCGNWVSDRVVAYCTAQSDRFGGQILCYFCQRAVPTLG